MAVVLTNKIGTLLGPLTTAWSMPDSCTVHAVNCATCGEGYRGQQCGIGTDGTGRPADHTSCWPPIISRAGTPAAPFHGWGFYSPGLACPTGYTAACTAVHGGRSDWEIQFTLIAGETAIGCCPEGFACTNHNGNSCVATSTSLTARTGMCSGAELSNLGQVTHPVSIDVTTTVTEETSTGGRGTVAVQTSKGVRLLAPMFQLNYRSSDLPAAATTTTPLSATAGASGSEAVTSAPAESAGSGPGASDSAAPAAEDDGLSTGAVVGIGVGAALGGILLGVLAIWLFFRNRKQKRAAAAAAAGGGWPEAQGGEEEQQFDHKYPAEMLVPNQHIPAEVWGQPRPVEIGTQPPLAEMRGTPGYVGSAGPMVELPTGNSHWSAQESPTRGYQ